MIRYCFHNFRYAMAEGFSEEDTENVIKISVNPETINRFITPLRMGIIGSSQSGKSSLMLEIIRYRKLLFTTEFQEIYFCVPANHLGVAKEYIEKLKSVCPTIRILTGLPPLTLFQSSRVPKLFMLDDMVEDVFREAYMEDVFTKLSHHWENSIIYTTQNYFNTKRNQTIVRNLNYRIIFNCNTQRRYMADLSSQISSDSNFLRNVFFKLESMEPSNNYLYVLIDQNNISPLKKYPVRAKILPDGDGEIRPLIFPVD